MDTQIFFAHPAGGKHKIISLHGDVCFEVGLTLSMDVLMEKVEERLKAAAPERCGSVLHIFDGVNSSAVVKEMSS